MQVISIDQAQPGMILDVAAEDFRGGVIIPAAAELSSRDIQKLKQWGIRELSIRSEGETDSAAEAEAIEEVRVHLERLEHRFASLHNLPIMEFFYLAEKKILEEKIGEGA